MTQLKNPEQLELDLERDGVFDVHVASASAMPASEREIVDRRIMNAHHINQFLNELETMCELYPGLRKAYKNFETVFGIVIQDYFKFKENNND